MAARFGLGLDLARGHAHGAAAPLDAMAAQLYAAYGLCRLVSAYAGPCLRVRRSSDNAQLDIGFAGGHLDVPALLAFVGTVSGTLATWYDQSGHGRHAAQASAGSQPRLVNAGVLDVGPSGRPVLVFDGVNDWLAPASAQGFARNAGHVTVAVAAQPVVNDNEFLFMCLSAASAHRASLCLPPATNLVQAIGTRVDGTVNQAFGRDRGSGSKRFIARFRYGEGQGDVAVDGAVTTSAFHDAGMTSDTDPATSVRIGSAWSDLYFTGAMSTLVLARAALDMASLDAALARTMP